jgi:hypothetical protein
MNDKKSVLDLLGLPSQFGYTLLIIGLILALAPYFSSYDFGVLKIPDFTDRTKKILRIIGPMSFLIAISFHLRLYDPNRPHSKPNNGHVLTHNGEVLALWEDGCMHHGRLISTHQGKSLIRFDFGEELLIDIHNIFLLHTSSLGRVNLDADVFVRLETGNIWAPGKVKTIQDEKYLIMIDQNAQCRGDKAYEWTTLENILIRG